MIETILKDFLAQTLPEVPVYLEIPAVKPKRYVVLEKIGGPMRNHLYDSMFTAQSYAESMYEAAKLSKSVVAAMFAAAELEEITRVSLNSEYNYTEPGTAQYRYQAVFDINHY